MNPVQKDIQSWPSKTNNLHLCRELNPEPHPPKSVIVRFELSSLDFSGQRNFASCLVAFHDPSVKTSNDHPKTEDSFSNK